MVSWNSSSDQLGALRRRYREGVQIFQLIRRTEPPSCSARLSISKWRSYTQVVDILHSPSSLVSSCYKVFEPKSHSFMVCVHRSCHHMGSRFENSGNGIPNCALSLSLQHLSILAVHMIYRKHGRWVRYVHQTLFSNLHAG